jgi:hypothetical protein
VAPSPDRSPLRGDLEYLLLSWQQQQFKIPLRGRPLLPAAPWARGNVRSSASTGAEAPATPPIKGPS